jgi:hypothetical protein
VPEEKADLLHAIYERIVVAGHAIVRFASRRRPTRGLALAMPEKVEMARPTGFEHALTTYTIPIEGRDEWEAAAAREALA